MAVLDGLETELEKRWDGDARLFGATSLPRARTVYVMKVDVAVELDSSGSEAAFVIVTLTDPPPSHEGWPVDEISELRDVVQESVYKVNPSFDLPWYVRFVAQVHPVDDQDAVEVGGCLDR